MSNMQEKQGGSDHQGGMSHSNLKLLVQGELHLIHAAGRGNVWGTQSTACRQLGSKDVHNAIWYAQYRAVLPMSSPV